MTQKKNFEKIIYTPLFDVEVVLLIGDYSIVKPWVKKNLQDYRKEEMFKMLDEHEIHDSTLATQFPMKGGGSLIWMRKGVGKNTLVHELSHATFHLMESKGIPHNHDTDEVYSYIIDYFCKELKI